MASFSFLSSSDGFPFCIGKINVQDYDYWRTLGGVSSGFASPEDIKLSRDNAMKLFWRYNGVTGSWEGESGNSASLVIDLAGNNYTQAIWYHIHTATTFHNVNILPEERMCVYPVNVYTENDDLTDYSTLDGRLHFVRMYNGATNNEDNFIGIGVTGFELYAEFDVLSVGANANLQLNSYGHNLTDPSLDGTFLTDVDLTKPATLQGIPFMLHFYSAYPPDSTSWSVSPGPDPQVDGSDGAKIRFDLISFQ